MTTARSSRLNRSIDWLFRDRRTGKITIAQFPNLPLWITLAAVVVQRVTNDGSVLDTIADRTAGVALGWWAIDEVARGVNPWRRILGAAGVVFAVLRLVNSLN